MWIRRFPRSSNEKCFTAFSEVRACRPWLEAEVQSLTPGCIVCLGATAAAAVLGPQARVMQLRGKVIADTA